jgi:peptidoglycan/xylan/chitin deacetylase (PgdA/CDA1 family)
MSLYLIIVLGAVAVAGCAPTIAVRAPATAAPVTAEMQPAAAATTSAPTAPAGDQLPTETATPAATLTASPTLTLPPPATSTPTLLPTATPTATATPTSGPTPDGTTRVARVPILMYHYVSEPPAGADPYRVDLSVSPERFENHLKYLQEAGYHTITLDDLLYFLTIGRPLPEKPVILTFDDGYEDNYLNAFPLLKKYKMVGHFFIMTDVVNSRRPGYMTWPQIEEMAAAGMRFGSHSRDHPDLRGKTVDYLVWQALGGMEAIQEHLGYHPRWISYPSGGYDEQVIAVYKSAHYWGGLATQQGATHTLEGIFALKRVRVRGSYTAADLAGSLELDW